MKKQILLLLLILSTHVHSGTATTDVARFIAQVQQVKSFVANFKQTTKDKQGKVLQTLEGVLQVKRPSKINWQTKPPFEQLVISDGELVWVYDMDLEQVSIRKLDNRIQETPALLLSGKSKDIKKYFNVSYKYQNKRHLYRLTPKDKSQLYSRLEFVYQGKQLQQMRIYDAAGQITDIQFMQAKSNQFIADKTFEFIVPEGVDVIDARYNP